MSIPGRLFLIPVPLGLTDPQLVLPPPVLEQARQLRHFVAENAKSARAFLKAAQTPHPLREIVIRELNEHTPTQEVAPLLEDLLQGHDVGLVSEAGCPAVADPGAQLVRLAQDKGLTVLPLIGPSSLLLALMASGLSGQNFAFHGYLSAKNDERSKQLKDLEAESRRLQRSQIFIETPYRNPALFDTLLTTLRPDTRLCLATDLTLPSQTIRSMTIGQWKHQAKDQGPDLGKRPTVFIIMAG